MVDQEFIDQCVKDMIREIDEKIIHDFNQAIGLRIPTYLRLIEETDTTIRVSENGMEVPGTECVLAGITEELIDAIITHTIHFVPDADKNPREYPVLFENGRIEICYLSSALPSARNSNEYILTKR